MVAHFDYYYNKGNPSNAKGVLLIAKLICGGTKMNANTDTTEGGYVGSLAHTAACPAIATALSTVLGSYLLSNNLLLSDVINSNVPSMIGTGVSGATVHWDWVSTQCSLPTEVQIFGTTIGSSSFMDVAESNEKLAVFNFINHVQAGRNIFWLRTIASSATFAVADLSGHVSVTVPTADRAMRPLIYIG